MRELKAVRAFKQHLDEETVLVRLPQQQQQHLQPQNQQLQQQEKLQQQQSHRPPLYYQPDQTFQQTQARKQELNTTKEIFYPPDLPSPSSGSAAACIGFEGFTKYGNEAAISQQTLNQLATNQVNVSTSRHVTEQKILNIPPQAVSGVF